MGRRKSDDLKLENSVPDWAVFEKIARKVEEAELTNRTQMEVTEVSTRRELFDR